MGKKDTMTKEYMSSPDIFADMFNKYLYHGKQRICPEQLQELDSTELVIPYGEDGTGIPEQRYRDVIKVVKTDGNMAYCILGIENQSDIHYAMPVRNMVYDSLQLAHQVSETANSHKRKNKNGLLGGAINDIAQTDGGRTGYRPTSDEFLSGFYKTDKLLPVVTLVVFFSPEEWDAPLSLREMYAIQDEEVLSLVADYKVNLLTPKDLTEAEIDEFHTSLREVLLYIKYSKDKEELGKIVEADNRFQSVERQVVELINTVTDSKLQIPEREESVNMCQAIREMREESRMEGLEEGREVGRLEGSIRTYIKFGYSAEEIAEEIDLSASKVREIMDSLD